MAGKVDLREVSDHNGRNVLHFAAVNGHLDLCTFLVEESGFDVNCTTTLGARAPPPPNR
jgi:ankyrin repeat protein